MPEAFPALRFWWSSRLHLFDHTPRPQCSLMQLWTVPLRQRVCKGLKTTVEPRTVRTAKCRLAGPAPKSYSTALHEDQQDDSAPLSPSSSRELVAAYANSGVPRRSRIPAHQNTLHSPYPPAPEVRSKSVSGARTAPPRDSISQKPVEQETKSLGSRRPSRRPSRRLNLTPRTRPAIPWRNHLWSTWRRRIISIEGRDFSGHDPSDCDEARVPTIDPRASAWVETLVGQLDGGQSFLYLKDLALAQDESPLYVWTQTAIWLLTYDPTTMMRFLVATHVRPYLPAIYVEDSLRCLTLIYTRGGEHDQQQKLSQLVDVFCTLSDRGEGDALSLLSRSVRDLIRDCTDQDIARVYEAIKLHSVDISWQACLHFASHFVSHNHFEEACEALWEARKRGASVSETPFRSVCSTLLRKSSEQPDGLRVCLRMVSALADIKVDLNLQMCNIIMLNAIEAGDLKTALSVYSSLVQRGLQPDGYTFAILLKGCKMNIDDAELLNKTIRSTIERVNVRENRVVATEILHCLALHHSKHNPTTALATLAEAYAQLFDLRPLVKLGLPLPTMRQVQEKPAPPDSHPLNIMIAMSIEHVLRHQPFANGLAVVYQRWRDLVHNGEPCVADLAKTDYTANIFLGAFIRQREGLVYAARVVRDMQQSLPSSAGVTQCLPTVMTWSIFLHGFTSHGKLKLAEQVLTYMRSKGIDPNLVTWSTLMTGYARAQDEEGVIDTVRRARGSGMVWNEWTDGGLRALRNRDRLEEELRKDSLAKQLDFTDELKQGLQERLAADEDVGSGDAAIKESSNAPSEYGSGESNFKPF